MAKHHYTLIFEHCADCGAPGVIVEDGNELMVSRELSVEPSSREQMELQRTISDNKPPSLIRDAVLGWVAQLELKYRRDRQC